MHHRCSYRTQRVVYLATVPHERSRRSPQRWPCGLQATGRVPEAAWPPLPGGVLSGANVRKFRVRKLGPWVRQGGLQVLMLRGLVRPRSTVKMAASASTVCSM